MTAGCPFDIVPFALANHVSDPQAFTQSCNDLYRCLVTTNETTNLTRISSEEDFWTKHVADSLSIGSVFPDLADREYRVVDVGCGAGFPSLILAIAFPNLSITAMDSVGKKTAFVAAMQQQLRLDNLQVVTGRSRELGRQVQWQHQFDIVTARAVSSADVLFKETRQLLVDNGRMIFYKTPLQAADEIALLKQRGQTKAIDWQVSNEFELPNGGGTRQFLHGRLP